jgi:predicted HTH transcriptional regulator
VSNNQKIIDAIDQFIKSKSEKTFLDFKVQWHEKNDTGNSSLVNDILCLCNCDYDEDRYLVIGVANNFFVKGIEADQNRRNVEELTDLTRNFNKHPEIEVQQVDYQKKELDVVIISYHRNHIRPFYIESLSDSQKKSYRKIFLQRTFSWSHLFKK